MTVMAVVNIQKSIKKATLYCFSSVCLTFKNRGNLLFSFLKLINERFLNFRNNKLRSI